jgi:protein O-mannosyl-transferase
MRREWIICGLLAALTAAVYWPVRLHEFVCYDDLSMILQNPLVVGGLTLRGLSWALTTSWFEYWHPVTWLSHMLDCELFGTSAGGHHLVSVAFHVLNALVLFLVLRRMTGCCWRSAVVAALFSLHPLRVESVAWVAERKDLLSGLFFLLTIWAYARNAEKSVVSGQWSVVSKPASRFYLLALVFFALGLMSKPMVVTLPFVLLLLDFWPLGRFQLNTKNSTLKTLLPLFREKVPFFALAAVCSALTPLILAGRPVNNMVENITWADRLVNAILSYYRYLAKFFWPTDLAVLYPHPACHYPVSENWPAWQIVTMILLLLAITAFCLYECRRWPFLAVGWFWYLGTLVPVIGLVQVGEQAMADRYTYIPLMGFLIGLVWLLGELSLGRYAFNRSSYDGPPGRASVLASPNSQDISGNQASQGRSPSQASVAGEARRRILDTMREPLLGALVVLALVGCLLLTRRQLQYWRNSVTLFEHTAEITADNPLAQLNLGFGLAMEGRPKLAAVRYRAALAIKPSYMQAHFNLAELLRQQEEWPAAAQHYEAAIRLAPGNSRLHLRLADALVRSGRTREAAAHLEEALRINPSLTPEPLNNLAWLLATGDRAEPRDGELAVRLAERACNLTDHKVTIMVGTLAAAYAQAGRFTEAVAAAEKACALADQNGEPVLLEKNQQLLQLYRAGKPYHEPQK